MTMISPYYADEWVTIYCGDARQILPEMAAGSAHVILTDPPWPGYTVPGLIGSDHAEELFREVACHFPRICDRLMVVLGCDTDPRFLRAVPESLDFQRVIWLRRTPPGNHQEPYGT